MTEHQENRDDVFAVFLDVIRARKVVILLGIASVMVTTSIGVYLMPPAYKASAKVFIGLPPTPRGNLPDFFDLGNRASFLNNQRELIRSRMIYEEVVTGLRLQENRGSPSLLKTAKKTFLKIDSYPFEEAVEGLYRDTSVDIIRGTNIVQITADSSSAVQASEIANMIAQTYVKYIDSFFSDKTQKAYNYIISQQENARNRLQTAQDNLKKHMEQENVISLISIDGAITISRNKLNDYENKMEKTEEEMRKVASGDFSPITAIGQDSDGKDGSIQTSGSSAVRKIENELASVRNEYRSVLAKNTELHPDVKRLKDQIARMEDLLAIEKEQYLTQRETVERQKEELSREKNIISQKKKVELEKSRQALIQQRLEELKLIKDKTKEQIQEENNKLKLMTKNATELARLTQEVSIREREYMMLREQIENAHFLKPEGTDKESGIRIIDPARPPGYPDSKKKIVLMVVGFLGSVVFGLGLAFIAEYVDDSLKNREDVEKFLKLPILGSIPPIPKKVWEGKKPF